MTALATLITTFSTRLAAKASRATADVIAVNFARHDLEVALNDLGNQVNIVAGGDPVIPEKGGFPSYETARVADPSPPCAPAGSKAYGRLERPGADTRGVRGTGLKEIHDYHSRIDPFAAVAVQTRLAS